MTTAELARRLGAKGSGKNWRAHCPAHNDGRASLSISEGRDGRVLLSCKAGCPTEAVLAKLGLSFSDLFPNGKGSATRSEIVETYDYTDEQGALLYQAVRFAPKDFRQRRSDGVGGWIWSLKGTRRVLFHLPQLLAASPSEPVYVVEGEKDVLALEHLGLVATTNAGGVGKWRPEFNGALAGRDVVVLPDNDAPGRTHAEQVAGALRAGAQSVRVLALPGLPLKGDVSDWIAQGGSADALRALVLQTREWEPTTVPTVPTVPPGDDDPEAGRTEALSWRTLADIDDQPPQDLLFGMLEPDGPNQLYAAGGVGKGTTFAWLIREGLKRGIRPLIFDAENRPKEWARRTSGLGIDRRQVVYLQPKDLPRDLLGAPLWSIVPHLGRVAKAAGCGILYVDSILAGMGIGEERLKSDAQAPYLYVAALDALGLPSVSAGHTPRANPEGDPYGSVSWVNAMRLTWLGTPVETAGHVVRWRPRKRNERGKIAAVRLTFSYADGKTLSGVTREDDDETTAEWILDALAREPRTVEAMAEELCEMAESEHTEAALVRAKARLRQALGRLKLQGRVEHEPGKRGAPWRRK